MRVIFASAKDGKKTYALYAISVLPRSRHLGLAYVRKTAIGRIARKISFMAIATFMTTTARIYVQTYAIYRLLSEITDDHLHVLLKYYYNVYLSYTSHNRPYHYHSRVQEINTHSALNSNFLIVVYCCK